MHSGASVQEPLHILLVEDNPGDVELVREYLASTELGPHELQVASSLGEACQQLRSAKPDVVLLDLRLPDGAGPEVVSRVRTNAGSVPIVVLSGQRADAQTTQACLLAGAQDYQSKTGLTADALLGALWRALAADDSSETARALAAVAETAHDALEAPGIPEGLRRALAGLAAAAKPPPAQAPPDEALAGGAPDRATPPTGTAPTGPPAAGTAPTASAEEEPGSGEGAPEPPAAAEGEPAGEAAQPAKPALPAPTAERRVVSLPQGGEAADADEEAEAEDPQRERSPSRRTTRPLRRRGANDELVTCSAAMGHILDTCRRVAPTPARVLILGETGTGKELLARAIHKESGRKGNFVAVNCAAIPASLIESELFGHERGAFTGAVERKRGLFAQADRGTLLLDEVGELPLPAQASTLRVLQEGMVRPVGGGEELPVDVRVIAATSAQLDMAVQEGKFREDLLYRLDVIRLVVPPLRERREDIVPLFHYYAQRLASAHGISPPQLDQDFLSGLTEYDWPGNVRQLVNVVERSLLTREGRLGGACLKELLGPRAGTAPPALPTPAELDPSRPLQDYVDEVERRYLESALRATGGSLQNTAVAAGVSSRTLLRKLKKHGLDRRKYREGA